MSLIPDGPTQPKTLSSYLQFIVDQLITLYNDGVEVIDSSADNVKINIKVMLLYTMADYPAHSLLTGQQKNGQHACMKCHITVSLY
jgi:hypothetical protein